jgi:CheY-like chemotaxis protein
MLGTGVTVTKNPGEIDLATVLVVDDSEFVRNFCSDVLTESGHTVLEAEDGEQALQIYHANQFKIDCVLLDVLMPGIDGLEVLKQIREFSEDIPILLMTGDDPGWARRTYEQYGATAFLSKALGADKLVEKVEEVILESET